MKLAMFGATSRIGSQILDEALSRRHQVTAILHRPFQVTLSHERLTVVIADLENILNSVSIANMVRRHDVVINAICPGDSISVETVLQVTRSLIDGLTCAGICRLVVVGSTGSLESASGLQYVDDPNFPEDYLPVALVQREAYNLYKASNLDWTLVSPALEIVPSEQTGRFWVGVDWLPLNAKGESYISVKDYAVAFMNEVAKSQYVHRRMTVAYP